MINTSKGLIITSLGVLIMSLESLFIKLSTISPITFSFYLGIFMFFSTSLTLFIKERDSLKDIIKVSFPILLLCGTLAGTSNIFFISAIKTTTVANVVIIFGTAAIFSTFFAYIFYKEKIGKNIFYASFFMFIGLFIIFNDKLGLGNLQGNIYALFCTISFSLVFVFLARYKKINRVAVTAVTGLVLSLITFIIADTIEIDLYNLAVVAGMGLLITPLSRVLLGVGTKYISASEVSLLMIIETIMAPIWVWMFLKEIPSLNTFIGGTIILLTLIVNSIYTMKRNR
ncbi:DMT family transporter [Arcobacter sp. LA11]|uniref:DMT family transporter n=1 Tax=Arcobacter sp. LA11 TaxID=1898176 RepID=UPI0009331720|nr:DMT family transporter [Arcobacter sp. LA11]